jgi:hypothetical protein
MAYDFNDLLLYVSLAVNVVLLWKMFSPVFIQKEKEEESPRVQAEKLLKLAFTGNEEARHEIENGIANRGWRFYDIIVFNSNEDIVLSADPSKPAPLVAIRLNDGSTKWERSSPMPVSVFSLKN